MEQMREIGTIKSIYRYPVKAMGGEQLASAVLGWHGIEGDRRYAFMRTGNMSGFPWLTASRMRELITYKVFFQPNNDGKESTVCVQTPEGKEFELQSPSLREELATKFGGDIELIRVDNGIFDDSPLSLISTATIKMLKTESGRTLDARRFRPNLLIETAEGGSLQEEAWVGKTLVLGSSPDAPGGRGNIYDVRCVMVNLDPDTGSSDPLVLKTIARFRNNCAGVYASIFR